jgi:Holliday junction resolvase-like predicted endonuclease
MGKKGAKTMTDAKGQDRLDRLEKLAEDMFAGIAQLRESQAAYAQERREAQRKIDEELLSLKESQAKTDEQLNRTDEQMRRTDAKLDRIGQQLGDLGLVQGEVAEDLFFRNLRGVFRKTKMDLKKVKRNLKRKGVGEFDLVAEDGDKVLVVEVKNKLDKRMVDRFVDKKLPKFKDLFPEYEKHQVVGAMGALVVKDDVGRYAEKAGLYVLTQTDEGGAALLNREGFKPRTFN